MNGEEWMSEKWSDEEEKKEEGSRNKYYKNIRESGHSTHTHTQHKTFVESSESAADDERRRWMIYKVKKEVACRGSSAAHSMHQTCLLWTQSRLSNARNQLDSCFESFKVSTDVEIVGWMLQNCITYCLTKSKDTETHRSERCESQKSWIIKLFLFSSNSLSLSLVSAAFNFFSNLAA